MRKLRTALPAVLAVWPYLLIGVLFSFGVENPFWNSDAALVLLCVYGLLTAVVYGFNIWNACTLREEKQLAGCSMAIKLAHIPFYLLVFFVGLVLLGSMVVPPLTFLSPFLILLLAAGDWLLMMTGSVYGIAAAVRGRAHRTLPQGTAAVCAALHCFFVLDVIGSIVLFCKLRRTGARGSV